MLFAVNVTAVLPATPANVGVFQAACVAVLAGAYHVSTPDAIAYGIVLQVVELATAVIMGLPALVNEGLSWREVRLRTIHAAPVQLGPLPAAPARARTRLRGRAGGRVDRLAAGIGARAAYARGDERSLGLHPALRRRLALHGLEHRRAAPPASATARARPSRYTASRLPVELALRAADARPQRGAARGGADQAARPRSRSSA